MNREPDKTGRPGGASRYFPISNATQSAGLAFLDFESMFDIFDGFLLRIKTINIW